MLTGVHEVQVVPRPYQKALRSAESIPNGKSLLQLNFTLTLNQTRPLSYMQRVSLFSQSTRRVTEKCHHLADVVVPATPASCRPGEIRAVSPPGESARHLQPATTAPLPPLHLTPAPCLYLLSLLTTIVASGI
jgi:hypothetical protein